VARVPFLPRHARDTEVLVVCYPVVVQAVDLTHPQSRIPTFADFLGRDAGRSLLAIRRRSRR
jgi:hypothetical protein